MSHFSQLISDRLLHAFNLRVLGLSISSKTGKCSYPLYLLVSDGLLAGRYLLSLKSRSIFSIWLLSSLSKRILTGVPSRPSAMFSRYSKSSLKFSLGMCVRQWL